MPFITTQDGWIVNLNQCVYIKPKNKDKDNKECPQIKMALTNGETLTCSFKTFKARDKQLKEIQSIAQFYIDENQ